VRVKQGSRELGLVMGALEQAARGTTPSWIAVDRESFSGRVLEKPQRQAIPLAAQEQLVVELYSK
jgi:small subunit ribosomal protein S4